MNSGSSNGGFTKPLFPCKGETHETYFSFQFKQHKIEDIFRAAREKTILRPSSDFMPELHRANEIPHLWSGESTNSKSISDFSSNLNLGKTHFAVPHGSGSTQRGVDSGVAVPELIKFQM